MRWPALAVNLWPGLRQLWLGSNWYGLALAAGAALLLNWALVISFLWTDWGAANVQAIAWVAVAVLWVSSGLTSGIWGDGSKVDGADADAGFVAAQSEYLQGNWFSGETRLRSLIKRNRNDVEARLMLATLLRHTGRLKEAQEALQRLLRMEGSRKWNLEIETELERLTEALADRNGTETTDGDSHTVAFPSSGPQRPAADSETGAADAETGAADAETGAADAA